MEKLNSDELTKKVQEVKEKEPDVLKQEVQNEHKVPIVIEELNDNVPNENLVPKIDEEPKKVKQVEIVNNA